MVINVNHQKENCYATKIELTHVHGPRTKAADGTNNTFWFKYLKSILSHNHGMHLLDYVSHNLELHGSQTDNIS